MIDVLRNCSLWSLECSGSQGSQGSQGWEGRKDPSVLCLLYLCVAAVTGIIPALSHIHQDLLTLDRIRPSSQTRDPPPHNLRDQLPSAWLSAFKLTEGRKGIFYHFR